MSIYKHTNKYLVNNILTDFEINSIEGNKQTRREYLYINNTF